MHLHYRHYRQIGKAPPEARHYLIIRTPREIPLSSTASKFCNNDSFNRIVVVKMYSSVPKLLYCVTVHTRTRMSFDRALYREAINWRFVAR